MSKGALLLDANSLFARSWYAAEAMEQPDMTVQLMMRTLLDLLTDPTRTDGAIDDALACWDGGSKNDKGRGPKPEGYFAMMDKCREAITLLTGIAQCRCPTEAEDQVATAAYWCAKREEYGNVVVASGDKDLKQVAGLLGKVRYYCLNNKDLLSNRVMCAKYGVKSPCQIGLALAILGDKVDNIAGVPNWGPAKVKKLFQDIAPDEDLCQIAEKILHQIPSHLQEGFLRDMELTILDLEVQGVPPPAPVVLANADTFFDLNLSSISHYGDLG